MITSAINGDRFSIRVSLSRIPPWFGIPQGRIYQTPHFGLCYNGELIRCVIGR